MAATCPTVWITSDAFPVEAGEDEATNPGVYGKAFAHWIAGQLRALGHDAGEPFAEDWGWCVPLGGHDFPMWVACANEHGSEATWGAYAVAEPGLVRRLFFRPDTAGPLAHVGQALRQTMTHAPGLQRLWIEDMP